MPDQSQSNAEAEDVGLVGRMGECRLEFFEPDAIQARVAAALEKQANRKRVYKKDGSNSK